MSPDPRRIRSERWIANLGSARPLLGTFLHIPSPQLVEIIGRSGFDFIILDLEHGEFDLSCLSELQRTAEVAGIHTVVRVAELSASQIGKALDFGADAVLVPHIESAADARSAVAAAKYPPEGERGAFPFMRASGYGAEHEGGWEAEQNRAASVILLVEGVAGIENIDEIVRVPGVASVFVGPVDLSQALGLPGQLRHPKIEALASQIGQKAADAGIHASIFCKDITAAREYAARGFKLIALSVDSHVILNAYRDLSTRFTDG